MTAIVSETALPQAVVEAPAEANKGAKGKRTWLILSVLGVAAASVGGWYYASHRGLESTDDAQIDADVVSVPTRTSGVVTKVAFADNQLVHAGDVLAELDAEPAKARLAQADASLESARATADAADADARVAETNARGNKSVAEASLQGASNSVNASHGQITEGEALVASAEATLRKATLDLDRTKKLVDVGSIASAQLESAQASYDTARAALAQAKAHVAALRSSTAQAVSRVQEANAKLQQSSNVDVLIEQARARARTAHAQVATLQAARDLAALDLAYTRIVAPQEGVVSKKTIAVGQMVQPGQAIVQLVPAQAVWVTGNFKETQLTKMRAGQTARVHVDAYPGLTVTGEVESFSAATGARFSLLPPDNATGNFTKVVQRVPVRVRLADLPEGVVLRPGMSVDLTVDTRK
jgi:membrane fusion protein (multidrug efflux system)